MSLWGSRGSFAPARRSYSSRSGIYSANRSRFKKRSYKTGRHLWERLAGAKGFVADVVRAYYTWYIQC